MTLESFERLGLQPGCTIEDVRKAYKKWALKTHPDRVPASQRARAEDAFHEIKEAYEVAMKHMEERGAYTGDDNDDGDDRKPSARNVHVMKNMFKDICSEIDREQEEALQVEAQRVKESLLDAWPNEAKCRPFLVPLLCFHLLKAKLQDNREILKFVCRFERDRIQKYQDQLQSSAAQTSAASKVKEELAKSRASHINDQWHQRRFKLTQYTMGWTSQDFADVTRHIGNEPAIRSAVFDLYNEQQARESAAATNQAEVQSKINESRLKSIANQIKDAFPNRERIKSILSTVLPWDRMTILSYLPEEIREIVGQIFGLLMPTGHSLSVAAAAPPAPPSNPRTKASKAKTLAVKSRPKRSGAKYRRQM